MKSTGIVRKVDELGRIVLPMELRNTFGIKERDPVEIYVDNDAIILKPYHRGCSECGSLDNLVEGVKVTLCKKCIQLYAAGAKQGSSV
jgi:looped-hinge helix DNA binding domain, AbrB family